MRNRSYHRDDAGTALALHHSMGKSLRKKTSFVPRLAYGCVGVGMGVIPLCATPACSDKSPESIGIEPAVFPDGSAPTVGIRPAIQHDASTSTIGIRPAITFDASAGEDAPTVGIEPYLPDASGEDAPTVGIVVRIPDASGEDAPTIGIRPAMPFDASAREDAPTVGIVPHIPDAASGHDAGG